MIEAKGLTKRYGATVAVDDLSFTVPPGQVTGHPESHMLRPWTGFGVFCLYAAALAAGFVLIGRRDA